MIANKKLFFTGFVLLAGFLTILFIMFTPIFGGGQNALNFLDNLYNSISKGSAYYIQDLKSQNQTFVGREIDVTIKITSADQVQNTAILFWKAGAAARAEGETLSVKGDIGNILAASLETANLMFYNNAETVRDTYGYDARQALYNWWAALKTINKELTRQKHFEEAKFVGSVETKALECAYNYYGVVPQHIGDKVLIVIFSLVFYVLYTLWFGYAIMFLFEGWGMDLAH